jgi:hypothetical protein
MQGINPIRALKPCYALNCKERIARHLLMCKKHWHMVGIATRERIMNALFAMKADTSSGPVRTYMIEITKAKLQVACWENCTMTTANKLGAEIKEWEKGGEHDV